MGRSAHQFLAGALSFYPLAKVRNLSAALGYSAKWIYPLSNGPTINQREKHEKRSPYGFDMDTLNVPDSTYVRWIRSPPIMGYTWNAELVTEVTDTGVRLQSKNDGVGQVSTDRDTTDIAAGTNVTGIIKGSFEGGDSVSNGPSLRAQDASGAAKDVSAALLALEGLASTSDVINGLSANLFGCPSAIYDQSNDVYLQGGKNEGSNTAGVTLGAMTTFVMHDVSPASGQTDLTVRQFRAPFNMRVLKVTVGSAGSASGNSWELFNVTQSQSVISNRSLSSVGSQDVEPDSGDMPAAGRNIAFDDILRLVVTTAGTGFTNLWCMVTCVVTGNAYGGLDNARTWSWRNQQAVANPTQAICEQLTDGPTKHYSGPVIGAPIALYIGGKDSSVSATDEQQQSLIAPFDMDVCHVAVFSHDSDANATTKVRNVTQGADIIAHIDADSDPSPSTNTQGNGTFAIANRSVKRGDVLSVFTTTTGVATLFAGAIILGVARGFPYPNAALD